jgi:ferredoxin-NADP reductase
MSMAKWLADIAAPTDLVFFNSVRGPSDIIFQREIELLTSRHRTFNTVIISSTRDTSSAWSGMTGRISRPMLEMAVPDLLERDVYMCGPEGFMDCVKGILADASFDLSRLHLESFTGVRTSVANKPAPLVSPGQAPGVMIDGGGETIAGPLAIEFARSGKMANTDGATTLLDLMEAQDIDYNYGCRAGSCGDCKVKLLSGEVAMDCEDGLEPEDKSSGHVLACVARPLTACSVDA